jgi:hypothetical protein
MDAENFDCVDLELTLATNVKTFDFVAPDDPLIPRGAGRYPTGAYDCGCIYAAVPVEVDGTTYIYYMGGNGQHTNFRETSFCRASFQKDKWAYLGLKDKSRTAQVMTSQFHFYGTYFDLLAELENEDDLQIGLFDHYRDDQPMEGYGFEDARIEKTEDGYYRIRFAKPLLDLDRKNPSIVIRLKGDSKLFALRGDLTIATGRYN